jgi:hypothetical protein
MNAEPVPTSCRRGWSFALPNQPERFVALVVLASSAAPYPDRFGVGDKFGSTRIGSGGDKFGTKARRARGERSWPPEVSPRV